MKNAHVESKDFLKTKMGLYNLKVPIIILVLKELFNIFFVINSFIKTLHYLDKRLKIFTSNKEMK